MTAAITIQGPPDSRPGDRYGLDVLQRLSHDGRLLGGSSYVIAVTTPAERPKHRATPARTAATTPAS